MLQAVSHLGLHEQQSVLLDGAQAAPCAKAQRADAYSLKKRPRQQEDGQGQQEAASAAETADKVGMGPRQYCRKHHDSFVTV